MADLFEFPYFEIQAGEEGDICKRITEGLHLEAEPLMRLDEVVHSFTRYRARLLPTLLEAACLVAPDGYAYHSFESCAKLPFSSGHRKILSQALRALR